MKNIYAIFKRELKSYFDSPIAYVFITVFLIVSGWLFFRSFFIRGQAQMRSFFHFLPWIFLFFLPAVTMRLWSEERRSGTMETLMTLPVKDYEAVLGKFSAAFAFLLISLILSFPVVLTVVLLGNPDEGSILGGYVGAVLLGGAYLAIGLFISSLNKNQIVSFILAVAVCFGFLVIGETFVLVTVPGSLAPLFRYLGLGAHFDSIGRGVIDSRDIIYYISVIFFFLYANVRYLEKNKWK